MQIHARFGSYFLQVPAMGAALYFFRDQLGLKLRHELCNCGKTDPTDEELASHLWLELDAGITIFLQKVDQIEPRDLGIGLEVENAQIAYEQLQKAGVYVLEQPKQITPEVKGFEIHDPFKNSIFIYGS
ncbi:VOC family protein [Tengunoibacter tsumagoiensis]|nr:VOC family protein [Tengunoibacter tsumagoiensis]